MYFKVLLQGVNSTSSRGRQKTKEPHSVTVYIQVNNGSLQWGQGSTLGMFLTGQSWEGEVTFLRKVPEHAHKAKMVDNRCVLPHLGQGGMSARGFKQRCTKTINTHGTHTHTHTGEHACNAM